MLRKVKSPIPLPWTWLGALQRLTINGNVSADTTVANITSYFNYVKIDTVSTLDGENTWTSISCATAGRTCLVLHNGAKLFIRPTVSFGGTGATNSLWFTLDADGKYGGSVTGPSKSVTFILFYNGRLTSYGQCGAAGYTCSTGSDTCDPVYDPTWFSWR